MSKYWMMIKCDAPDPARHRRELADWTNELLTEALAGEAGSGIELDSDETYNLSVLARFHTAVLKAPDDGDPPGALAVLVPHGTPEEYRDEVARAIGDAVQHLLDRERLRLGGEGSAALRGMIALQSRLHCA